MAHDASSSRTRIDQQERHERLAVVGLVRAPDGLDRVPGHEAVGVEDPGCDHGSGCRYDSATTAPSPVGVAELPWGRQRFVAVNEAHRATIERAARGQLTDRQWRLLAVVCCHLASWSRLVDRITHAELAERAGVQLNWRIGDDLKALSQAGVIRYLPGVRNRPSVVGFLHEPVGICDPSIPHGTVSEPPRNGESNTNGFVINHQRVRGASKGKHKRDTKRETKGPPSLERVSSASQVLSQDDLERQSAA
jgi:hypothetical protein